MPRNGREKRDVPVRAAPALQILMAELERTEVFRSAADLHVVLRGAGHRTGLSTVYRHLHELAVTGRVDCVRGESGERLFRLRHRNEHAHYLFCRRCGVGSEVGDDALERHLSQLGEGTGYSDVRHDLSLSGICSRCTTTTADAHRR
jgi:Fur family ferric uptake transcriptional regulator